MPITKGQVEGRIPNFEVSSVYDFGGKTFTIQGRYILERPIPGVISVEGGHATLVCEREKWFGDEVKKN